MSQPPFPSSRPPPPYGPGYAPQGPPAYGYGPPPQAAPQVGMLDALVPTNPLAAVSCWTGILSIVICGTGIILGPLAIVTGIVSLKNGMALVQESQYGRAASTARSWIGIVSGGIGLLISLLFVATMLIGN